MTAIVYDHKNQQIAVDSRCICDGQIKTDSDIKFKEINGDMWFFAGSTADEPRLVDYHKSVSPEPPKFRIDASAMVVSGQDVFIYGVTEDGEPFKSPLRFNDCMGSGGLFALCALDFGLSAKEAIEYSKTKDAGCGGDVHVYDIKLGEFL